MSEDLVVKFLKEQGWPVTRENWLKVAYMCAPLTGDEWGPELELEMPSELRRPEFRDEPEESA